MFRTIGLTVLAMIAFAANSLLSRAALGAGAIDAATFTALRLVSGAVLLALVASASRPRAAAARGDWLAVCALVGYAFAFSFAYRSLSAGTGALILFGGAQLTMFLAGLHAGERFSALAWTGFALAAAGVVYLVSPSVAAPSFEAAALMGVASIGWGLYSVRGRGVADALRATTGNFMRSLPLVAAAALVTVGAWHASWYGIALAIVCGAVTTGVGYVIWYAALADLTVTRAATVQLSVPLLAAIGGVLLLGERLSWRLVLSAVAIVGGLALVFGQRAPSPEVLRRRA